MNFLKCNTNVTLILKNQEIILDIAKIPTVSLNTQIIFKDLGTETSNYLIYPLKTKAEVLTDTVQKLQNAKDHGTRDKIFGLLRSALTVAIVMGGILGALAMSWHFLAAVGISTITFIAYFIISYYNAHQAGLMDLAMLEYVGPLFILISSPLLPIYEGFGKISRIESSIVEQKKNMSVNFSELVSFFRHDRKDLEKKLEEEIKKSEQSLEIIKQLPLNSLSVKKEIEEKLDKDSRALDELIKGKAYYSQFQI